MKYMSAGCAFHASAGRTPLQAPSVSPPSECARCFPASITRRVKRTGKCQAVLGRHSLSHGAPGSHFHVEIQRHQQWRCLLSLAAAPGLKAAADSASGVSELYTTDSFGGNGGASGSGGGPWGNGDGSSGMSPSSAAYIHVEMAAVTEPVLQHEHQCIPICQSEASEMGVICRVY